MAASLNKVTLIGNIGSDPEIRTTSDGKELASFSLATSDRWKDKVTGELKEKTEWHRIVAFKESLVNVIKEYVKKGARLYIEGQLQTRKWKDNHEVEKYTTEVILQGYDARLIMLDGRNSSASAGGGNPFASDSSTRISGNANKSDASMNHDDDNLPF